MKLILTLFLVLILQASILACGAPQLVFGHISTWTSPRLVLVNLDTNQVVAVARANPFGFFSFVEPVGPCPEQYRVDIYSKRGSFPSTTFHSDGSGTPIWLEISASNLIIK